MAGHFSRARYAKIWSSRHFGYVIIDECACAPEPISLIPIAGTLIVSIFWFFDLIFKSSFNFIIFK